MAEEKLLTQSEGNEQKTQNKEVDKIEDYGMVIGYFERIIFFY